jgi:hypothetical protein
LCPWCSRHNVEATILQVAQSPEGGVVYDGDVTEETRKEDKLWKVRPLLDQLRQGCLKQIRAKNVSIDEQMIPFSGACHVRQYVPNKPTPVGLKNFVLADSGGLVLDFVIYQGATTFLSSDDTSDLNAGGVVVAQLGNSLPEGCHIFCDRYFTSISLIDHMYAKKIHVTGTVMKNQLPREAKSKLTDDKILSAQGRGSSVVISRRDEKVCVVKWYDKKPIILASSAYAIQPSDQCRRYCKKEKQYIQVQRPSIVKIYNESMGGVDLTDRMMSYYRMKARTKKWTIRTIFHFIDLVLVNSWIKYRRDCTELSVPPRQILKFLKFRMEVAEAFIVSPQESINSSSDSDDDQAPTHSKKRRTLPIPSAPKHKSGAKHLPEMVAAKNSMRCRNTNCSKKTKVKCMYCNVFLCLVPERNCFASFHE